jgi:pilus assembly protein Flp/PilA
MLRPTTGSRGQGLLEYALIIALVVVLVLIVLALVGPAVRDMFNTIIPLI